MPSILDSFFLLGPKPENIEEGYYLWPLVLLSFLVASLASFAALSLAQLVTDAESRRERRLLQAGGALAMGAGIWSMHFIGMLSYRMRMYVEYEPWLTVLSMLFAIGASYIALTSVARQSLTPRRVFVGAIVMGLGISSMHYTGMAAMQMDGIIRYTPGIFTLSVLIAISASAAALIIAFSLARHHSFYRYILQIIAALVMGGAICGMHYTAMASAVFISNPICRYAPDQDFQGFAITIAIVTGLVLCLSLGLGVYRNSKTELRLRNSENRLRLMIDSALDAVIGMNNNGIITEWNKRAENLFGWTAAEAVGQILANLIIPQELREAHRNGMERFLADGVGPLLNRQVEVEAVNRRGDRFPVEMAISVQQLRDGEYHFTAFLRDISARKSAEKDRSLLVAIVESSDDAIISRSDDGIITSWNRGAEKLFGYSVSEALGRHLSFIIPVNRFHEEDAIYSKVLAGEPVNHYETIRIKKDGTPVDVSLTVSSIRDSSGNVVGASKIIRNITDRKHAEAELKRYTKSLEDSNRELDDFAYVASHDLKEPLRGMHNFSEFLLQDHAPRLDEEGTMMLQTISKLAMRLDSLLNSLLQYSRLGRTDLAVQETDLDELVKKVLEILTIKIKETGAEVKIPRKLPVAMCDHVRIAEVFQNLIANALKYHDGKPPTIEIGYAQSHPNAPDQTVFYVRDNGIGIEKKNLDSVFKMFKRLHAQDAYGGGTGSGLAIAKKIIARHGGNIWAESEGAGQGTTFYFTIPGK